MSRTVTALYDTRAEAEAARERLSSACRADGIRIIDKNDGGSGGLSSFYLSDEDRQAYGEGIRRGGFLLCAEVDGDSDPDRIVALLEESASVDLEERQQSWRNEGWNPSSTSSSSSGQSTDQASAGASGARVEEQRIPIVEEELRVGKREIERGGARVRSYIRETPVQEQVTLREEHVEVERRPVDRPVSTSAADNEGLLQERSIEMRETAEEAVVQKVANVREEVVVTKTAEERTETIEDTVRRTEVDIEGAEGRPAFGGFGSGGQDASSGSDGQRAGFNREDSSR
jgi:uncharacterized protein (TIGR02271 family)